MSIRFQAASFKPSLSFVLLLLLLLALWIAGGASRAEVSGQVVIRAVAWSALVLLLLFGRWPSIRGRVPVLVFLTAALLLALVQLIPLPPGIWQGLPGRALLADAMVGGPQPWRPWSMVPSATLNAASSLVVPFATLALVCSLDRNERARLPTLLLAMIVMSTLVGLLQFSGAGVRNPFLNDTVGEVSGTFANRNHFAVFVAFGCLLAPVWAMQHSAATIWRLVLAAGLVLLFALTILATGSRAGMVGGILAIALGLWLVHQEIRGLFRRMPRWLLPTGIVVFVGLIVVVGLISVAADRAVAVSRAFSVDLSEDMRSRGLTTVLEMIRTYFPLGSGLGGFDPIFRLHEPFTLLKPTFFNHAHDDFLEIALDTGIPGIMLLVLALGWWGWTGFRVWCGVREGRTLALTGAAILLLVLLASLFDYPARTPTMMAFIVIAGLWLSDGNRRPHGSALPI